MHVIGPAKDYFFLYISYICTAVLSSYKWSFIIYSHLFSISWILAYSYLFKLYMLIFVTQNLIVFYTLVSILSYSCYDFHDFSLNSFPVYSFALHCYISVRIIYYTFNLLISVSSIFSRVLNFLRIKYFCLVIILIKI